MLLHMPLYPRGRGMCFPQFPRRLSSTLARQYPHEVSDDDDLDCLPQSDDSSERSQSPDDYCLHRNAPTLSEVESASVSPSGSRRSFELAAGLDLDSDLSEPDFPGVETDDSQAESDSDGELSIANNVDLEDDTCESEVPLPPQLPYVAEERLQEVWPMGEAAFAIFTCPITHDVMSDPVVSADGYTYERSAIARWFETSRKSPVTGQKLPHAELVPNQSVRTLLKTLIDMTAPQVEKKQLCVTPSQKEPGKMRTCELQTPKLVPIPDHRPSSSSSSSSSSSAVRRGEKLACQC
ncbi:unnamed protein product [Effrenium voratum]|nr:unnamed protein product [Effrenium voratum]